MKRDGYWRATKYIVSDERAFVYFVVPKVACSSIKTALLPAFPDMDQGPHFARELESGEFGYRVHGLFDRSKHQVNKQRLLKDLGRGRYRNHFRFTLVRNPYDRLLSCDLHKLSADGPGQGFRLLMYPEGPLRVGMSFAEFVEAVHEIPDEEANPHFRSQHVTVCEDGPEKRPLADFIGRYENLKADFALITDRIGLEARLPHLLPSRDAGRHYREYYDRRLARLAGERYRRDAEVFGYSF
jgi:hypothetical protein